MAVTQVPHCLCIDLASLILLHTTMQATRSFQVSSRHPGELPKAHAQNSSQPTAASRPADPWRLYTCRMPLVGLEGVAAALKNTPVASLLQLHTYLLLEGPCNGSDADHVSWQSSAARILGSSTDGQSTHPLGLSCCRLAYGI